MNNLITNIQNFLMARDPLFYSGLIIIVLIILSYSFSQSIFLILKRRLKTQLKKILPKEIRKLIYVSVKTLLPFVLILFITPVLKLTPGITVIFNHALLILFILAFTSLVIRFIIAGSNLLLLKYDITLKDNLKARGVYTQVNIIQKIIIFIVLIFAIALIFLSFDSIRQIGLSILASAGVVGLIIGLAAQKTIATILAGIQLAIAQPIRLDDVVVVEGEWGRIEEITLTYVVVRIWDLRRLVLPVTYFIEKPFQNWTRTSASVLGTVLLYVDPSVPVEELRSELKRIVTGSDLWNNSVVGLQVTGFKEHSVELRALVSTDDASKGWDLRCYVREKLLLYLQKNHPGSFVKIRVQNPK